MVNRLQPKRVRFSTSLRSASHVTLCARVKQLVPTNLTLVLPRSPKRRQTDRPIGCTCISSLQADRGSKSTRRSPLNHNPTEYHWLNPIRLTSACRLDLGQKSTYSQLARRGRVSESLAGAQCTVWTDGKVAGCPQQCAHKRRHTAAHPTSVFVVPGRRVGEHKAMPGTAATGVVIKHHLAPKRSLRQRHSL